jgi:hypothetical protein
MTRAHNAGRLNRIENEEANMSKRARDESDSEDRSHDSDDSDDSDDGRQRRRMNPAPMIVPPREPSSANPAPQAPVGDGETAEDLFRRTQIWSLSEMKVRPQSTVDQFKQNLLQQAMDKGSLVDFALRSQSDAMVSYGHKAALAAGSQYFQGLFETGLFETDTVDNISGWVSMPYSGPLVAFMRDLIYVGKVTSEMLRQDFMNGKLLWELVDYLGLEKVQRQLFETFSSRTVIPALTINSPEVTAACYEYLQQQNSTSNVRLFTEQQVRGVPADFFLKVAIECNNGVNHIYHKDYWNRLKVQRILQMMAFFHKVNAKLKRSETYPYTTRETWSGFPLEQALDLGVLWETDIQEFMRADLLSRELAIKLMTEGESVTRKTMGEWRGKRIVNIGETSIKRVTYGVFDRGFRHYGMTSLFETDEGSIAFLKNTHELVFLDEEQKPTHGMILDGVCQDNVWRMPMQMAYAKSSKVLWFLFHSLGRKNIIMTYDTDGKVLCDKFDTRYTLFLNTLNPKP